MAAELGVQSFLLLAPAYVSTSSGSFTATSTTVAPDGAFHHVLDLSCVEMLDARGLGVLVFLHNWACATGIQMKFVNPSKLVREMLEVTGLTSLLHVSSVDDVVEMFCTSHHALENVDRAVA